MTVESAADRLALLSDFGATATYTPAGGAAIEVVGIYDNEYIAVDAGGTVAFASTSPRFFCRTADIASAARGDALTVDSVAYTVVDIQPDGTGMTNLILEKV